MQPQTPLNAPLANPQQQVIDRLRSAVNVLVTVSNNPSVDQLAAAIGFTLMLNKLGKHATAVFSGNVPSTLEFLKPEETIEKNTDSLRDFIISLDKSKADKLRYKVEADVVKIFITPYRTSLSEKDLEFGQGDFNVDVVVALGVSEQRELDQAITAHGRILHGASVITISAGDKQSTLGAINWHDPSAASLCEMLVTVGDSLQSNLLDAQDATALLTGIVAQTDRFSNEKTTPRVMSMAAQLMAAGANQQLIATQLDKENVPAVTGTAKAASDGSLVIAHEEKDETKEIAIDEHGNLLSDDNKPAGSDGATLPPALDDSTLRDIEKSVDSKHIAHDPTSTLDEIEESVDSPHVDTKPADTSTAFIETPKDELVLPPVEDSPSETVEEVKEEQVDDARDAVQDAISAAPYDEDRPDPLAAINATPVDLQDRPLPKVDTLPPALDADPTAATESATNDMFTATDKVEPKKLDNAVDNVNDTTPPPPVPPPMMPMQ